MNKYYSLISFLSGDVEITGRNLDGVERSEATASSTNRGVHGPAESSMQAGSAGARSGTPEPTLHETGGVLWPGSYCSFSFMILPKLISNAAPNSFLLHSVWSKVGQKHIRVAFKLSFQRGSLTGRNALTRYPLTFDKDEDPTRVYLFWTDGKSIMRDGLVELQDIGPAQPKKKGLQVMLLDGSHVGEIVKVTKLTKAAEKISVGTGDGKPWDEPLEITCIVEDHADTNCEACSKWVRACG